MDQASLTQPRLVVLDTAHFAGLVADILSGDHQRKRVALNFVPDLLVSGWLPLICFHHIEELLQHRDESLVDARLRYLESLPIAAWIFPSDPDAGPGSILEVLRAEATAAFSSPGADAFRVRDLAADRLIAVGSGRDAIPDSLRDRRFLRDALAERQHNSRRVAAITRWRATDIDDTPISELLGRQMRSKEETARQLERLRATLENEIGKRGDKRISDPGKMAAEFLQEVVARADQMDLDNYGDDPAMQILMSSGLHRDDINPSATFGETMDLLTFQNRLRLVMRDFNVPWVKIKSRVAQKQLPVILIEEAMRRYSQDQPERKGSELNDTHLACLALYADITYVDKRTLENIRRVRSKEDIVDRLMGRVERAIDHVAVTALLSRL